MLEDRQGSEPPAASRADPGPPLWPCLQILDTEPGARAPEGRNTHVHPLQLSAAAPALTPPDPRIATDSPLHTPPPAPIPPDPRIATASPLHTLPPGLPLQSVQLPVLPTPRVVPATLGQLTRSQPRTSLPGPLPPCQAVLPALCIPVCPEALCSGSPRAIWPRRSQEGAGGQAETTDDPAEPGSREAARGHR